MIRLYFISYSFHKQNNIGPIFVILSTGYLKRLKGALFFSSFKNKQNINFKIIENKAGNKIM